jgi:chromosome segregation protein
LQTRLDNDKDLTSWLTQHNLDHAPRLWQSVRIEQGWEDALEAVLRERLNALALSSLEETANWKDVPPAKLAVFARQRRLALRWH